MTRVQRWRAPGFPVLAMISLIALLCVGLGIAIVNERASRQQLVREAGAQADLLASAVSGALAFDDRKVAQDYVDAVRVNPNVMTAAVYNAKTDLIASFSREGQTAAAPKAAPSRGAILANDRLIVSRPVQEAGQTLGSVRLTVLGTSPSQRFNRYAGMLLVLGLAMLVVAILAAAQTALRRANRELVRRAEELAEANALLKHEMETREKAEEALRQSQKMEAIGQLTGGIAHDFNNLLMVASSGVELLDRTSDPGKRRALSAGVRQAVERGAALTRQLLAFSRQSPLKSEVLDLKAQLQGLRFLLERSLREDIVVEMSLADDLWRLEADPGELELAMLNLAVNARDAMPSGGVLRLTAENAPLDGEGQFVRLTVSDTGVGMAEEVAKRVFEPFFTTKQVGQGTGLGLSQVYGFVRSSGGSITVQSAEGQGTTFVLLLPRSTKPLQSSAAGDGGSTTPTSTLIKRRLLLVEDDDAVAEAVGGMLGHLGVTHARAGNAAEALTLLQAGERYDLTLSDMVMPGAMNGLQFAAAVREQFPALPVVLTTGFSEAAAAANAAGFPLLPKPYAMNDLAAVLARALEAGARAGEPG